MVSGEVLVFLFAAHHRSSGVSATPNLLSRSLASQLGSSLSEQ